MLRKFLVFAVVLSLGSMAFAVNVPGGWARFKFQDFTTYYRNGVPVDVWTLDRTDENDWIGLEVRTIFHVTSLGSVDPTTTLYTPTWFETPQEEVTGVFHSVVVSGHHYEGPAPGETYGEITLDHAPFPPAAPPPTDTDWKANGAIPLPPYPPMTNFNGARLTLYTEANPTAATRFSNDPAGGNTGPLQWSAMTPDGRLLYPGATEGEILFDGVMPDLINYKSGLAIGGIHTIKRINLDLDTRSGHGEFFLNSIDGVPGDPARLTVKGGVVAEDWAGQKALWSDFATAIWAEAHGETDLSLAPPGTSFGGWSIDSDDPVDIYIVPEPTTCVLLGGALVALIRRRKRRS